MLSLTGRTFERGIQRGKFGFVIARFESRGKVLDFVFWSEKSLMTDLRLSRT